MGSSVVRRLSSEMRPETEKLAAGLLEGKRAALARCITLVESRKEEHQEEAEKLLESVLSVRKPLASKHGGRTVTPWSFRLGLAGPPGAGKSTLIESLGMHLCGLGHRVAVVAVDPSSSRSGGSILGDKTRMTELSRHPNAYVRPSPTSGVLGGVAEHTNEVILLCEAAGYDVVIVETVGLGQSEVVVDETVDMLTLVTPPGGGDELQGVKRGIMELVDAVLVNKADGPLLGPARHAAADFRRALQLTKPKHPMWKPQVQLISAAENRGIQEFWELCCDFKAQTDKSDPTSTLDLNETPSYRLHRRAKQAESWLWSGVERNLIRKIKQNPTIRSNASNILTQLAQGTSTPRRGAKAIVQQFLSQQF